MMYIDSSNKKIQLFVSPSDSLRSHRKDLQNFMRALVPLLKENDGESIEIPQDLFDLLD